MADPDVAVARAVEHERRHAHGGENVAHVELGDEPEERACYTGARREALEAAERRELVRVVGERGRRQLQLASGAPALEPPLDSALLGSARGCRSGSPRPRGDAPKRR